MDDMRGYWEQEFISAFEMLKSKLYLPDGYNYGKEKGIENDTRIDMISLKADIERDIRSGEIMDWYRYYTIEIWRLLGIKGS